MDVDKLNEDILKTLPGEGQVYLSVDAVMIGDEQGLYVTTEFLNGINLSGLPPHQLTVKVGCVMMLLRNLNPKQGLCNYTYKQESRSNLPKNWVTITRFFLCSRSTLRAFSRCGYPPNDLVNTDILDTNH